MHRASSGSKAELATAATDARQVWCTVLLQPGKPPGKLRNNGNLPRTCWRRCQYTPKTFRIFTVDITGPILSCHLCRVPLGIFSYLNLNHVPALVGLLGWVDTATLQIASWDPGRRFARAAACRLSPDVLLSCCGTSKAFRKAFPLIMCKAKWELCSKFGIVWMQFLWDVDTGT